MIALKIAVEKQTIPEERYLNLLDELQAIPEKAKELLNVRHDHIEDLAEKYKDAVMHCTWAVDIIFPLRWKVR